MQKKNDTGSIHISDEVIAICAANGTLNTDGVVGLWGGITENIKENRSKRNNPRGQNHIIASILINLWFTFITFGTK